jgi:hypothetical protein
MLDPDYTFTALGRKEEGSVLFCKKELKNLYLF